MRVRTSVVRWFMLSITLALVINLSYGQPNIQDRFTTFGIIARDTIEETWGCALATNNISVGQYGVFEIKPDVGIITSIAYTNPDYPINGIKLLESGLGLRETFDSLIHNDKYPHFRQIAMMDSHGKTLSYTGNVFQSYTIAGSIDEQNVIVFGNSFSNVVVLNTMLNAFKETRGKLYKRLTETLLAGQKSGGQNSGKMSTSLMVKKSKETGFNDVDIRVDYSLNPFEDLKKLVEKKEGIGMLQKARMQTNTDSALLYLNKSTVLLSGWTLMYTELAKEFYKLNRSDLSIEILKKGIKKDKLFKNLLPSNYYLIDNKAYKKEIKKVEFGIHDWLEAVHSMIEMNEFTKAETIGRKVLTTFPDSSHLNLLIGKALEGQKKLEEAQTFYLKAYELDNNNFEAQQKIKER